MFLPAHDIRKGPQEARLPIILFGVSAFWVTGIVRPQAPQGGCCDRFVCCSGISSGTRGFGAEFH